MGREQDPERTGYKTDGSEGGNSEEQILPYGSWVC